MGSVAFCRSKMAKSPSGKSAGRRHLAHALSTLIPGLVPRRLYLEVIQRMEGMSRGYQASAGCPEMGHGRH